MKLGLKDRFSIVKGFLYLTLGICCVYLIVTGRYLNYIAPRYELLLGISSVALILGGLATVIWAPSRYYKHNWRSIVPIIIPVVLLIVPPVLVPTTGVQGVAKVCARMTLRASQHSGGHAYPSVFECRPE